MRGGHLTPDNKDKTAGDFTVLLTTRGLSREAPHKLTPGEIRQDPGDKEQDREERGDLLHSGELTAGPDRSETGTEQSEVRRRGEELRRGCWPSGSTT